MPTTPFGFLSSSGPPVVNDWSNWDGSGDAPFSPLGAGYAVYSQNAGTIATIPIDATRFLLVSEGYLNSDTSTYFTAILRVGTLTANQPTFGDPVELDADMTTAQGLNVFYRGINLADGKVYLYYAWYDGTQEFSYAKVINIDGDGNITFGPRSANIGTSAPLNSATPSSLAKNNFGTPIHLFTQSGTGNAWIVSTSIAGDDTITVNTPFDTGLRASGRDTVECLNSSLILMINTGVVRAYPLSAGVISSSVASFTLFPIDQQYNLTSAIAAISSTKAAITYDRSDGGPNILLCSIIVTYNAGGPTLTGGTESIIFSGPTSTLVSALELLDINNNADQVIATYFAFSIDQYMANAYAVCLTPLGGGLFQSTPIQINANLADINNISLYPFSQSAIMNASTIVSPYISYNRNINYGVTVLNRENILVTPTLLYELDAADGIVTTTPFSVANGTGVLGNTALTIVGDVTNIFVPGIMFYEDSNPAQSHIVTSSSFSAGNTTVIFTTGLYNALSNTPLTFTGIEIISTTGALYTTFFRNIAGGNKACLGELNGLPTIIVFSTDSSVPLTSDPIASADAGLASSLLATDFTMFIVCHITSGCIIDTKTDANLLDPASQQASFRLNAQDGVLFPGATDNIIVDYSGTAPQSGLLVLAVTRNNLQCIAYVNGAVVYGSAAGTLAMGSSISHILFNNFNGDNPAVGAISNVQFWAGSFSGSGILNQSNVLKTKYSIS